MNYRTVYSSKLAKLDTHTRDNFDRRSIVTGGLVTTASIGLSSLYGSDSQAAETPEKLFVQPRDRFQFIKGPNKGDFVRPDLLELGGRPQETFPIDASAKILRRKNRLNRILALKLDPAEMDEATRARSVDGVLLYSALCTHRNCTIKSWLAEERRLRCHCHLSIFAALSEGSVESGPARRQLPMVPVGLDDDGFVIALDGFTRKPGAAKK